MSLIPEDVMCRIPPLGASPETPLRQSLIHARLYDPESSWEWLVMECDGRNVCFGLIVTRLAALAGRFTLVELESVVATDGGGGGVLFDPLFEPLTAEDLGGRDHRVEKLLGEFESARVSAPRDLVSLEGLD
jgi:hypothetical protein